jgi:hypothetical protein
MHVMQQCGEDYGHTVLQDLPQLVLLSLMQQLLPASAAVAAGLPPPCVAAAVANMDDDGATHVAVLLPVGMQGYLHKAPIIVSTTVLLVTAAVADVPASLPHNNALQQVL